MKISDPFSPSSQSTHTDPSLCPPPLTFETLKKAMSFLKKNIIVRFEVNTDLFNEIVASIPNAKPPVFKLVKPQVLKYIRYDLIPIIHNPNQVESLKIIRRKVKLLKERKKDLKMLDIRIKEGNRKKGGLNKMPNVPRPAPPKAQRGIGRKVVNYDQET